MGGIRKKTSNRGTTRQRASIKRKASETRRKNGKHAKKDVTWKSNKTKDPGIPNNFPYKEQVLAEMAEQKRLADEHKQAVKAARKAANAAPVPVTNDGESDDEDEENPGIIKLHGRVPVNPVAATKVAPAQAEDDAGSPPPDLVDTLLPTIQSALDRAHVCVELIDARDPPTFRSTFLENAILEGQDSTAKRGWTDKLLIVLNKVDLIPREAAEAWIRALKDEFKGNKNVEVCLFKSSMTTAVPNKAAVANPTTGMNPGIPIGRDGLVAILRSWATEKSAADKKSKKTTPEDEGLVISVLGHPNVGKSSFINTLLGRPVHPTAATTKTSGTAPTTLTPSESVLPLSVSGPTRISIIDTPGWEFNPPDVDAEMERTQETDAIEEQNKIWDELEQLVARDMLTRNLGRIDKVKDSYPLVKQLVKRANVQDLTLAYTVPAFVAGDVEGFLTGVARSQGRLKKHGIPDLDGAGRAILRDWALDTFPYYTLPASSKKDKAAAAKALRDELDARDAAVLAALKTKAEMKREGPRGLIRLKVGSVDDRELILDEEYGADVDSEESDDEDAGFPVGDEDEEDDDEEDEDPEDDLEEGSESGEEVAFSNDEEPVSSEEEEEAPIVTLPPSKKRKAAQEPAPLKKRKVEFDLSPSVPSNKAKASVNESKPNGKASGKADSNDKSKSNVNVNGNDKKRRRASDQGAAPTTKKAKVGRK